MVSENSSKENNKNEWTRVLLGCTCFSQIQIHFMRYRKKHILFSIEVASECVMQGKQHDVPVATYTRHVQILAYLADMPSSLKPHPSSITQQQQFSPFVII